MHFFTLLSALATCVCVSAAGHWQYPDWENGEKFPEWGGTCDSGRRQSPINLSHQGALKGYYDKLVFKNYDEEQKTATIVNNGHTIQLSGFADTMELSGGPLKDVFVVEQLHFHWWSEHTIDHIRFPLEVHVVHRNERYPNISEALRHRNGVAVVGVLFHASSRQNEAIAKVLQGLEQVKGFERLNRPTQLNDLHLAIAELLPHVTGYMTYPGSLTTPSCAEAVTWIVLTETFPVQLEQVDSFKEVEFAEGRPLTANYRDIQKSNHRPLVVVAKDGQLQPSSGGASSGIRSLGGPVAALLFLASYAQ